MADRTSLLIVEDDAPLREAMETYLQSAGFQVFGAVDGRDGLAKLYLHRPQLVVLDIMMPRMDGWETCRRIRELTDVPIILLTAMGQDADKVRGLEIGADDYLVKPISLRELEARIRGILRRSGQGAPAGSGPLYADEYLVVDAARWEVRCQGQIVDLSATERRLLFLLVENAGRILPTSLILDRVWGPQYVDDRDYVKLYIWRLRRKIEPNPRKPTYIHTNHGIGYCFAPSS